jgi:hypothetical protein
VRSRKSRRDSSPAIRGYLPAEAKKLSRFG